MVSEVALAMMAPLLSTMEMSSKCVRTDLALANIPEMAWAAAGLSGSIWVAFRA